MSIKARPKKIRTDEATPEMIENMMMWVEETLRDLDVRIAALETQGADHETRITALE